MSDRILVTRSSMPEFEEYCEEIRPLWESHWLTNMGVEHKKLESELKERLGTPNVCLFTNGHNALECILEALNLRGEVITTPFSFASTTHAISRKGLTPVFADVSESDCTLDPECIERMITPRTCAIVPVHVYGNLCDVDAIQEIADPTASRLSTMRRMLLALSAMTFPRLHLAMRLCLVSMPPKCLTPSRAVRSVSRIPTFTTL